MIQEKMQISYKIMTDHCSQVKDNDTSYNQV